MHYKILFLGTVLGMCAFVTGTSSAPRVKPTYVFVHENAVDRRVWGYKLGTAGELTPLAKSAVTVTGAAFTGGGPTGTMAFSVSKKTLFVSGGSGISCLKVAKSGQLKTVAGSPFGGTALLGITSVDLGKQTFVYAADPEGDRILGFSASSTGKLTPVPGASFTAGDRPITLSAAGTLLFAANANDRSISAYRIGAAGALTLTPGSPFALSDSTLPFGMAVSNGGAFVYVADCLGTSQIFGLSTNAATGALSTLPNSPTPSPTGEVCAGLTLAGPSLLYACQFEGSGVKDIQAFQRQANGALLPLGGLQSSGTGVDLAATDPTGAILVAARSQGNQALRSFTITPATGVLTARATQSPAWSTVDGLVVVQP